MAALNLQENKLPTFNSVSFLVSVSQKSDRNRPLIGHGLGNGAESMGESIHWPHIQRQSLFYGGWRHYYQCQQRQVAGPRVVYLFRCLWSVSTSGACTLARFSRPIKKIQGKFKISLFLSILIGCSNVLTNQKPYKLVQHIFLYRTGLWLLPVIYERLNAVGLGNGS